MDFAWRAFNASGCIMVESEDSVIFKKQTDLYALKFHIQCALFL
jgi:hypothetical protein